MSKNRQNEYFVPRDGIDREVITADICRYLGNDALVRPGTYDNPQTGQIIQGYFINAYRNLTTAMIEDLKADSARWDQERRQQSARSTAGGTIASRNTNGVHSRKSNSPVVQYRNSETHNSRQYYGPTDAASGGFSSDNNQRDPYGDSAPRGYPGTGSSGYSGASSGSAQPQQQYASHGGYGGAPAFSSSQSPQYGSQPAMANYQSGYPSGGNPYIPTGANLGVSAAPPVSDPYAHSRVPASSMPPSMNPTVSPVYTSGHPASYQSHSGPPQSGYPSQNSRSVAPVDQFYGRGLANSYGQDPSYDMPQSTPAPTSRTPTGSAAPSRSGRDSVERHPDSRRHRSGR